METPSPEAARPGVAAEPANLALRRLCEALLAAWVDFHAAPPDDHRAGLWGQMDAAVAQGDAIGAFLEALGDLAPDGIEGIPLDETATPLRVALTQMRALKTGHVGALLMPAQRPNGRPPMPADEAQRRVCRVAACKLYEDSGMPESAALAEAVRVLAEASPGWCGHSADAEKLLTLWARELGEQDPQSQPRQYYRRLLAEAQSRLDSGDFDLAALRDFAELLLRQAWP